MFKKSSSFFEDLVFSARSMVLISMFLSLAYLTNFSQKYSKDNIISQDQISFGSQNCEINPESPQTPCENGTSQEISGENLIENSDTVHYENYSSQEGDSHGESVIIRDLDEFRNDEDFGNFSLQSSSDTNLTQSNNFCPDNEVCISEPNTILYAVPEQSPVLYTQTVPVQTIIPQNLVTSQFVDVNTAVYTNNSFLPLPAIQNPFILPQTVINQPVFSNAPKKKTTQPFILPRPNDSIYPGPFVFVDQNNVQYQTQGSMDQQPQIIVNNPIFVSGPIIVQSSEPQKNEIPSENKIDREVQVVGVRKTGVKKKAGKSKRNRDMFQTRKDPCVNFEENQSEVFSAEAENLLRLKKLSVLENVEAVSGSGYRAVNQRMQTNSLLEDSIGLAEIEICNILNEIIEKAAEQESNPKNSGRITEIELRENNEKYQISENLGNNPTRESSVIKFGQSYDVSVDLRLPEGKTNNFEVRKFEKSKRLNNKSGFRKNSGIGIKKSLENTFKDNNLTANLNEHEREKLNTEQRNELSSQIDLTNFARSPSTSSFEEDRRDKDIPVCSSYLEVRNKPESSFDEQVESVKPKNYVKKNEKFKKVKSKNSFETGYSTHNKQKTVRNMYNFSIENILCSDEHRDESQDLTNENILNDDILINSDQFQGKETHNKTTNLQQDNVNFQNLQSKFTDFSIEKFLIKNSTEPKRFVFNKKLKQKLSNFSIENILGSENQQSQRSNTLERFMDPFYNAGTSQQKGNCSFSQQNDMLNDSLNLNVLETVESQGISQLFNRLELRFCEKVRNLGLCYFTSQNSYECAFKHISTTSRLISTEDLRIFLFESKNDISERIERIRAHFSDELSQENILLDLYIEVLEISMFQLMNCTFLALNSEEDQHDPIVILMNDFYNSISVGAFSNSDDEKEKVIVYIFKEIQRFEERLLDMEEN